jgi:hypothetical protein
MAAKTNATFLHLISIFEFKFFTVFTRHKRQRTH